MISFFLLLIAIFSFIFFGVVGEDKAFLMAPAFILNYGLVFGWWIGKLRGVREQVEPVRIPFDLLCWFLFILYGCIMIPFSDVVFHSKMELLFLGGVVGAFTVWRNECKTFRGNALHINLLIFVVLLCALYGFVIHFKSPEQILWAERYTDAYEGRLRSTYICPNHFAHLLQMLLPFLVVWIFISQVSTSFKGLAAYAFVAFLFPLFLTESRAGWLGSISALGVLGLLFAWRRSKKLFWIMLIIIPVVGSSILVAGYFYSETFQRRMEPVVEFIAGQAEGGIGSEARDFRPQTWADTLVMVGEEPVFGHGPGAYRYTYPEFRERFKGQRIVTGHPHNEYLELAADYGWIGFGLFAVAWLSSLGRCLIFSFRSKETRHAFVGFAAVAMGLGTMVHSFFDFQMHIYPNAMIFAALLAFAMAPMERHQKKRGFRIKHPTGLWIGIILAFVGFIFCVKVMTSSYMRAYADKQFVSASENTLPHYWAENAIKWDASNWQAHLSKASILYDLRYYSLNLTKKVEIAHQERSAYENAYVHNEKSPKACSGLGKVNIFLSKHAKHENEAVEYKKQGFMYLEKACSLRKYNDLYWWNLGSELRQGGLYSEALDIFKKAGKIKNSVSIRANIEWLQERLNPEIISVDSNHQNHDLTTDAQLKNDNNSIQHIIQLMERWEMPDEL